MSLSNLKITSDGTSIGTTVFTDEGVELTHVGAITVQIDPDSGIAVADIRIIGPTLNLTITPENQIFSLQNFNSPPGKIREDVKTPKKLEVFGRTPQEPG